MNEVNVLRAKNAYLQGELHRLYRIANMTRQERTLRLAAKNARQMIEWRFRGDSISQRACIEMGMSRRSWEWGRALLMAARIHNGIDITEGSFQACMEAVNVTERAIKSNGLQPVLIRLPRWAAAQQRKQ